MIEIMILWVFVGFMVGIWVFLSDRIWNTLGDLILLSICGIVIGPLCLIVWIIIEVFIAPWFSIKIKK